MYSSFLLGTVSRINAMGGSSRKYIQLTNLDTIILLLFQKTQAGKKMQQAI
jgi:hypothetical protein